MRGYREGLEGENTDTQRSLGGVMGLFIVLTVMMVSCVYTYVKTYAIVHFQYNMFRLLYVNYTSITLFKK